MNYKQKLPSAFKAGPDSTKLVAGLLACVAAGAILGVLLAPGSGKDTREKISKKAKGLADDVQDKLQSLKDKYYEQAEELADLKEQVTTSARNKARSVVSEISDAKTAAIDKARSRVKATADDLNDSVQDI